MRNGFGTVLETVQNDYGMSWSFELQDSSGAALDISESSLTFKAQLNSDRSVQFENPMIVTNASQGLCQYMIQQGDFMASGNWSIQIMVSYVTGEVITFSGITVSVDPEIPLE